MEFFSDFQTCTKERKFQKQGLIQIDLLRSVRPARAKPGPLRPFVIPAYNSSYLTHVYILCKPLPSRYVDQLINVNTDCENKKIYVNF